MQTERDDEQPTPATVPPGVANHVAHEQRNVHTRTYIEIASVARKSQHALVQRPRPLPGEKYVERSDDEKLLQACLVDENHFPLILLSGVHGVGKTTLAAYVIDRLVGEAFPGGSLWGDLDQLPPHDQLRRFLYALDERWDSVEHGPPLRELFWQRLAQARPPTLVVFDNVHDLRQLRELLPASLDDLGQCRVLVITTATGAPPDQRWQHVELRPFDEQDSLTLFKLHLPPSLAKLYEKKLVEISQRLEHIPQLLSIAAQDLASKTITPSAYLGLLQADGERPFSADAYQDALSLAARDLGPPQRELLTMLGIIRAGDWPVEMLAALVLRPPEQVARELEPLIKRGLVTPRSPGRFLCSARVRQFTGTLFQQQPPYVQRATAHLLARFCLDLIQDRAAAIAPQARNPLRADIAAYPLDVSFIKALHEQLVPDLSHIRGVLEWAQQKEEWSILRRFAYLPALEVFTWLKANAFELRLSLTMGTVLEPLVWPYGEEQELEFDTLISSAGWAFRGFDDDGPIEVVQEQGAVETRFRQWAPLAGDSDSDRLQAGDSELQAGRIDPSPDPRTAHCELSLSMLAGQVIDGILLDTALVDTNWCGVRASGLVLRHVDLVGCMLTACDLSGSVWYHCDARRLALGNSNLSRALFRHVRMHTAQLDGADLRAAVLEHVDLRGASLRDVDLRGADLRDVDLRGADLRGADLRAATLADVQLLGCRLQGVQWGGATDAGGLQADDRLIESEIRQAMAAERYEPPLKRLERPSREALLAGTQTHSKRSFERADLRARSLVGDKLPTCNLSHSDLRGAILSKAALPAGTLLQADLRGALLKEAMLSGADLAGADMRGALLEQANLEGATLTGAVLRRAYLHKTILNDARAQGAKFQGANLVGATLQNAILDEADFSGADLSGADLGKARLRGAVLQGASLTNATLTGADLTGALCDRADFSDSDVDAEQLAVAASLYGAVLPYWLRIPPPAILGPAPTELMEGSQLFRSFGGKVTGGDYSNQTLYGARFDEQGSWRNTRFVKADLRFSRLEGVFSQTNFAGAWLNRAMLSGIFSFVDFTGANFTGASFRGASLVNAIFAEAQNLAEEQLQQAVRLRGTILPDGTRYAGQWRLAGDLLDADRARYNLNDPEDFAEFYRGGMLRYRG